MDTLEQMTFNHIRVADFHRRIDSIQQNIEVLDSKLAEWNKRQIRLEKQGYVELKERLHAARCYNEIKSVFDIKMTILLGHPIRARKNQ